MSQKWNLGDIKPSDRKPRRPRSMREGSMAAPQRAERPARQPKPRPTYGRIGSGKNRTPLFVGGVAVLIIVVAVLIAGALGGATVQITPKTQDVTIDTAVTASPDTAGGLSYELLTLEAEGERQVSVSGSEEVSEQATGTITIYNEYSTSVQRLIKNTRFESPEGLIYRIQESVVVPGITKDSEGNTIAGSIEAEVFADAPGEAYNIGPSRFTIPGLEGSDQYDRMYAESTNAFTGGFEGEQYLIDGGDLTTAQTALHGELEEALRVRLEEERPLGFTLFDDAVTFAYDTLPSADAGEGKATIRERVRLVVPLFKDESFAQFVAQNTIADYKDEPVLLQNIDSLSFTYGEDTAQVADISTAASISFTLAGKATLIWQFDEAALREDLTGVSRALLLSVLSEYPAILRAEAKIHPFWRKSFPDNSDDITFETTIPE
ncbi:hypothetical protein KTR10_02765 [Candidatus Kaiserbacteria bacterium]|nr:hypothetical protein [Candidatus Kaiserbacteria bacterium]